MVVNLVHGASAGTRVLGTPLRSAGPDVLRGLWVKGLLQRVAASTKPLPLPQRIVFLLKHQPGLLWSPSGCGSLREDHSKAGVSFLLEGVREAL